MKSSQVLQLPDRLYLHQQTCTFCQKPLPTQSNAVLCSSGCADLLAHTTWAFVQGFLIGCVLCLCRNAATEPQSEEPEKGVCGHDCLVPTSAADRPGQEGIKSESVDVETDSSFSSAVDDTALPLLKTKCEEARMSEVDRDSINTPVHFEMDLLHGPSLNSHIDFEVETGDIVSVVKQSEEMIAVLPSVSVKNTASSPASERPNENESMSFGMSPTNSADGMLLSKKMKSGCDTDTLFSEQNIAVSNEMQQSFSNEESSVSNVTESKKFDHHSKSDSNRVNFSFKRTYNKHKCVHCCKSFCNKRLLIQHIKSHRTGNRSLQEESRQSFTCEFCAQIFMNRYSLKAHIRRKHSGEEPVECDICGKVQPGSFALGAHKKACHNFHSLCHICGAEFSGRTSFDKHMTCHEGIKRFFCDICGAGFVHSSSLNNHSSVHLTTKSFQCDICSQLFKAQHLLNEHLLKAHQCGPSLEHRISGLKKMGVEVDRDAIRRHANSQCLVCCELLVDGVCLSHPDNSQDVFRCVTCGDRTSNIVLFYQHVKWHRGTIVSHNRRTAFAAKAPASRHLSRSEPGTSASSLIKCEVCAKTFKNFEYLSAHMHQHREARFVCEVCNKQFTYKCNLKSHMNTHLDTWQFECETCRKTFRDKHAFKKHQLKHTEPQFKCQVCGKALTRRPYLIKHYQKMHPEYQEGLQP